MRKPKVENKYNLKPKDIQHARIIDYDRLHKPPFWRNDVVQAWCLAENTCKNSEDYEYGCYSSYWIGFYDKEAKAYAGKIRLECSVYGDSCSYNFETFFNPKEIENELDLEIQEKLLSRINWLIDEKIIEIQGTMSKNSIEYNDDDYKKKYYDMVNSLKDFNIFLDNAIDAEMDKLPVSNMDAVRKSSYCLALERCRNSIFNILKGKPFDFVE